MKIVYILILMLITVFIVIDMFEEKRITSQIGAVPVLVMFILRILMIK